MRSVTRLRSTPATCERARQSVSRRTVVMRSTALVGGAVLLASLASPGRASANAKVSQSEAHYRDTPSGSSSCEKCRQFQPPSACKLVDGTVSPSGWCNFFAAR
jgi:hypothetical protein